MDIRKVKKLIELLEESGIAEIEITEGEEAVRISRFPTTVPVAAPVAQPATMLAAQVPAAASTEAPAAPPVPETIGHKILAPMVGTFYRSPTPEAEPFVKVGDQIQAGDTLCVVEAMKMMNQIDSDVSGKVLSVEVENGEPIEFDQVLFVIG